MSGSFLFFNQWLKNYEKCFLFHLKAFFALKIFRFLYFPLLSFSPVSHCSKRWSKINLRVYYVISCPNKNLKTHIVWYLDKESRSDIETWSINRVLRAKRTFKTWNFYFAQILTEVVEKQHVLTPLNFFF